MNQTHTLSLNNENNLRENLSFQSIQGVKPPAMNFIGCLSFVEWTNHQINEKTSSWRNAIFENFVSFFFVSFYSIITAAIIKFTSTINMLTSKRFTHQTVPSALSTIFHFFFYTSQYHHSIIFMSIHRIALYTMNFSIWFISFNLSLRNDRHVASTHAS